MYVQNEKRKKHFKKKRKVINMIDANEGVKTVGWIAIIFAVLYWLFHFSFSVSLGI